MKKGWEVKNLGDLADIKGGKRVPKGYHLEIEPTDYPYIRVTDFNDNGSVDLNDIHYVSEEVFKQIKNYTISTKDLYISIAGTIGKTGIIPKELDGANLTENACKLIFRIGVEPKFIYYFTKTEDFLKQAGLNTRVAAMPKLALTRLSTIALKFPQSLQEQQRIVTILDNAFTAISKLKANAEHNLKNSRELFESYLQGVFENRGEGWEERKLIHIGLTQTGTTPKTSEKENYGNFIPFIKPADVNFTGVGDIRYDNEGLSEIGLNKGRKIEKNSILMVCIGATIGKVGLTNKEISCNQQINSLTLKNQYSPNFIYYAMTSKEFQNKILLEGKGAQATLPIINKTKWENLVIPFPKLLSEQQAIVAKLDALSAETKKLESIYQHKINNLEELKKSILQKAFNGELDTESVNDEIILTS